MRAPVLGRSPLAACHCPLVRKSGLPSELVCRLIAEQFPQWAHLPVRPVDVDGWDNASFRLGDDMSVRGARDGAYAAAADREHRCLPALADQLPLPIPRPPGKGRPIPPPAG